MTFLPFAAAFSPHEDLAASLLADATESDDGSHDIAHVLRVFRNAMRIAEVEGGNGRILTAAVLLHDCVAIEKNSPLRSQASRLAADKAGEILAGLHWDATDIAAVGHAIAAHSFSANIRARDATRRKSCRMRIGWMPSA